MTRHTKETSGGASTLMQSKSTACPIPPKSLQIKNSAILLLFLGVLFSLPIVAKTFSAHGVLAALLSGLLVVALVFMGPISFSITRLIETDLFFATSDTTGLEFGGILLCGAILFLAWLKPLLRKPEHPLPYVPVTGWALIGAYFCVLHIFTHIT